MAELGSSASLESASGTVRNLRRLGKNLGGYFGETVEMRKILAACSSCARAQGWTGDSMIVGEDLKLLALHRPALCASPRARIYLSAGIHGDEPAGPLAIKKLLEDDRLPLDFDYWVCPCLNPTGFDVNRRENLHGTDLNRQYLQPQAREIIAHVAWLERQPKFDLCFCLHEDWEAHGFYLYELNPDQLPSIAETIIKSVQQVCPIDGSDIIDGRPAQNGIIRPELDALVRAHWPEAFFLLMHKTRLSYTLESPSDFDLHVRVRALSAAVEAALGAFQRSG